MDHFEEAVTNIRDLVHLGQASPNPTGNRACLSRSHNRAHRSP